jgi:multicopper oxidase
MVGRQWTINGRTFDQAKPLPVGTGERLRLVFGNQSMMVHPMHLHGHTFQIQQDVRPGPARTPWSSARCSSWPSTWTPTTRASG